MVKTFNNNQLNFDLEKIMDYSVVSAIIDKDKNLDYPYILEINDNSYFYVSAKERNEDFRKIMEFI